MNLSKNTKVTQVLGYYDAAQTERDSDIIDMSGYDGVMFIALFDTLISTGTIVLSAEQNTTNSASGMATLAGATTYTCGASDSGNCLVLDVYRPKERYVRANLTFGVANSVIGGIVAIQYCGNKMVATTGALNVDTLISPAES